MKREVSQRWVLSFADLTLLLLAFFVLMQAQNADKAKVVAGIRAAFGGDAGQRRAPDAVAVSPLFEGGEAILTAGARARFAKIGADAAKKNTPLIIASQGRDSGSARLDAWEMAAARTTAIARALRAGGLSDAMIEISIPPMRADDPSRGQTISIRPQKP